MKRTKKMVAALALVPRGVDPYTDLERNGYKWDSKAGKWQKRPPITDIKTGVVDIRLRAGTGEIKDVAVMVADALKERGFAPVRVSLPDPDDRDGPAITARVYMQFSVPR